MTFNEQEKLVAKGGRLPQQGPKQLTKHGLFLYELDLLCIKHSVWIEHEDGHGSGLLYDADPGAGGCGISFCFEDYE